MSESLKAVDMIIFYWQKISLKHCDETHSSCAFQMRERIVEKLDEIPETSLEAVQQKTAVMFEVTKEKDEITQKSLATGAKVVATLSTGLVDLTQNATSQQIEETGK